MIDRPSRQRGAALIISLLIAAAISALGIASHHMVKQDLKLTAALVDQQQALLTARSGIHYLIYQRLTSRASLRYEGALPVATSLSPLPIGWNIAGEEFSYKAGLKLSQQSLSTTLPIATVLERPTTLYAALSSQLPPQEAAVISDAILDWIDSDDLTRLNGAEQEWYKKQQLPLPLNRLPASIGGLRQLKGMTPDNWPAVKALLSLNSGGDWNWLAATTNQLKELGGVGQVLAEQRTQTQDTHKLAGLLSQAEQYKFAIGSRYRLTAVATQGLATARQQATIIKVPFGTQPYYIAEWK